MRRLLIASTVLALVSVVPASAQAATLTFSQPCYAAGVGSLPDQPIAFTLTGGTPGLRYTVKPDFPGGLSTTEVRGSFDAAGNASGVFTSYNVTGLSINPSRGRPATFTATRGANLFGQTPIAQAGITVTNKALTIPVRGGFRKRTWKMSGVKPFYGSSSAYYASWVKGTRGKRVVKRSRLGRARAPAATWRSSGCCRRPAAAAPGPCTCTRARSWTRRGRSPSRSGSSSSRR